MGDYDNDGWQDLYITYYGKNRLYHNQGDGTFTEVAETAGVAGSGKAWGAGCAFLDYDRDGLLDLVGPTTSTSTWPTPPPPARGPTASGKVLP